MKLVSGDRAKKTLRVWPPSITRRLWGLARYGDHMVAALLKQILSPIKKEKKNNNNSKTLHLDFSVMCSGQLFAILRCFNHTWKPSQIFCCFFAQHFEYNIDFYMVLIFMFSATLQHTIKTKQVTRLNWRK